jgi:ADP-ribosylglycohydrolase
MRSATRRSSRPGSVDLNRRPPPSPELRAWTNRGGSRFSPYVEELPAGTYTDDTQLTLAVARSLLTAGTPWWSAFTRTELPLWLLYKRGGGRGTKRAARCWAKGIPPWLHHDEESVRQYFEHGGNGVAMRVVPHAIFLAGERRPTNLMQDIISDGMATHGHPRALIGARVYAFAAWKLLRAGRTARSGNVVEYLLDKSDVWGEVPSDADDRGDWWTRANRSTRGGYKRLWSKVVREMRGLLSQVRSSLGNGATVDDEKVLRDLGAYERPGKGSGTVSTAAAVYLASRYAAQPVQGVVRAAFAVGTDTDTVGAIVGGLSGCMAGSDWLPDGWLEVQDHEYLRAVARSLAAGPRGAGEAVGLRQVGQRYLKEIIDKLFEGHQGDIDLDGVRTARATRAHNLTDLSKTTVTTGWELRT